MMLLRVMMPSSLHRSSTTGSLLIFFRRSRFAASSMEVVGRTQTGSDVITSPTLQKGNTSKAFVS